MKVHTINLRMKNKYLKKKEFQKITWVVKNTCNYYVWDWFTRHLNSINVYVWILLCTPLIHPCQIIFERVLMFMADKFFLNITIWDNARVLPSPLLSVYCSLTLIYRMNAEFKHKLCLSVDLNLEDFQSFEGACEIITSSYNIILIAEHV